MLHPREHQMVHLAVVEAQLLELQEAEVVDTDWATTGIYFLKGVRPLVPPILPLAHRPPPTAETGTAVTTGTDEGYMTCSVTCLV